MTVGTYLCGHHGSRTLVLHDPGRLAILEAIEEGVLQSLVNTDGIPAAAGCLGVACAQVRGGKAALVAGDRVALELLGSSTEALTVTKTIVGGEGYGRSVGQHCTVDTVGGGGLPGFPFQRLSHWGE